MSYTPGPWRWSDDGYREELVSPTGAVLRFWAQYADNMGVDVSDADARLIEASPALADLLRRLVAEHDQKIRAAIPTASSCACWLCREASALLATIDGAPATETEE